MTPDAMATLHARAFTNQRPWSASEFASLVGNPHVLLLTDAQGFLLAQILAGEAEILTLAVDPEGQRQGRAGQLVARFLTEAVARSATRAFLDVAADNVPAIALYSRAGFRDVGRRRGYFSRAHGPAVDAVVMARDLPVS